MRKLKILFATKWIYEPNGEEELRKEITHMANPLSEEHEVSIAEELLSDRVSELLKEQRFDVLITHLPDNFSGKGPFSFIDESIIKSYGAGIDRIGEIKKAYPGMKIIVFSGGPIKDPRYGTDIELKIRGVYKIFQKRFDSQGLKEMLSALEKIAQEK